MSRAPTLRAPSLVAAALLLIPISTATAGCRKRSRRPKPQPTAPRRTARAPLTTAQRQACARLDSLVLPAGLHFRRHTFDTCGDKARCPTPTAAVLLAIARTAAAAERRTRRAAQARPPLPPGYPLVVHTDELGLADPTLDGVAVVAGLFRTPEAARRWRSACVTAHPTARVLPLATSAVAAARFPAGLPRRHYVVRLSAGPPVPAYAEQDLEQLPVTRRRGGLKVTPLCTLAPGRLFVFNTHHIHWYRWAPVHCGTRKAYVRWTDTLLATTILRRRTGGVLLRQVTRVECDQPQITTWRYDRQGRHPQRKPAQRKRP